MGISDFDDPVAASGRGKGGDDAIVAPSGIPVPSGAGTAAALAPLLMPLPHGGGLAAAMARYGHPASEWLDLSTGINPWPYPLPDTLPLSAWARLPDSDAQERLARAALTYYGAASPTQALAAAGSQAVITALPWLVLRLWGPVRVGVCGFTYGEHAHAWRLAGHSVETLPDDGAAVLSLVAQDRIRVVIRTHPNNPDGTLWPRPLLLTLADELGARGGLLVVDEAFADLVPAHSLAAGMGERSSLILLRSFGKFFGLAGLRLGFALAPPAWAPGLRALLGPWPVSGPAALIATQAFQDRAWQAEARSWLASQAAALDRVLVAAGLRLVGGTDLFRLVATPPGGPSAAEIDSRLGRRAILVRSFAERPQWLRIGLPADGEGVVRVALALSGL